MAGDRYQIRIDPWWQPLLMAGGASPANAYVEINGDAIDLRLGWLFRETLRRNDVAEAAIRQWPLWMGVGWRTNFVDQVGLIGSYRGVVELRLHAPIRVWRVVRCRRIAVSLVEPGRFLEALSASIAPISL